MEDEDLDALRAKLMKVHGNWEQAANDYDHRLIQFATKVRNELRMRSYRFQHRKGDEDLLFVLRFNREEHLYDLIEFEELDATVISSINQCYHDNEGYKQNAQPIRGENVFGQHRIIGFICRKVER